VTYRVDENGWTWMPVVDILRNTYTSIDYDHIDWELILAKKCADTGFGHLVNSIMTHGWRSAIGWHEGKITEGHHRLCAAILLCEDEVPTTRDSTCWSRDGKIYDPVVSAHDNFDDPYPIYLLED
jgi:hypothetical protein